MTGLAEQVATEPTLIEVDPGISVYIPRGRTIPACLVGLPLRRATGPRLDHTVEYRVCPRGRDARIFKRAKKARMFVSRLHLDSSEVAIHKRQVGPWEPLESLPDPKAQD